MTGIIRIRKKGSEETFDHVPRSNEAQLFRSNIQLDGAAFRFLDCRDFPKSRESRQ